jgi:hypothetical protein
MKASARTIVAMKQANHPSRFGEHEARPRTPVLGLDRGRVIIGAADQSGHADTSFLSSSDEDALTTPPCEGAFETIAELCDAFDGNVWLVSKCGPRIQSLTRRWLARQRFHELTGVAEERVLFCARRPEKRDHCARIEATHFVDDRLDVLRHLAGLVPHLYWFGHQTSDAQPAWVERTPDWADARKAILSDLPGFL